MNRISAIENRLISTVGNANTKYYPQIQSIIRAVLFVLFFSIGAGSLSISILSKDLVQHYKNAELLRAAEDSLERLRSLNADYAVVIERLQADPNDPNAVKHLARVTLGPEHQEPNTVYPRATAELLAAAERAITADSNHTDAGQSEPAIPFWLSRCSEPRRKTALFICGVVLVLTSLVCFGPREDVE
ncbi:MAG: hypothetical protein ACYTFQ_28310 [Planctomycetota bacterium]